MGFFYEQAFLLLIGFLVGYNYRGQTNEYKPGNGAAGQSDTY